MGPGRLLASLAARTLDRSPAAPPTAGTIGAGDSFTRSLAAALAHGEPLEQAMQWANAAAAPSAKGTAP
jgi:ribokinase